MSKKKGKGRLDFSALVQRYKSQDFAGARLQFRKAKINPQEQDDARRLWVELTHRLAADLFETHQYAQALASLDVLKTEDFPKKSEQLQIAHLALKGLCKLYLGEWASAANDLESVAGSDLADKLGFYYLLASMLGGAFSLPPAAGSRQAAEWEKLSDSRQLYLRFAAALLARDAVAANRLLKDMEPLSDQHGANLLALRAARLGEPLPGNLDRTFVKPLYKIFAGIPPSDQDSAWLETRPVVGDFIRAQRQGARLDSLAALLHRLCEQGSSLTELEVEYCRTQLPQEMHPYLLYNQAAALFRENQEENGNAINRLAEKHPWQFFQAPESIFLYLRTVTSEGEGYRGSTFFNNLEQYLRQFGETLSLAQLNEIGWLCFDVFLSADIAFKSGVEKKRLAQLVAKFPQVVGFKFWLLIDTSSTPSTPPWHDALLDVFALPNVQDFGTRINREVDALLDGLYPELEKFQGLVPFAVPPEVMQGMFKNYIQQFELLQKNLLSAMRSPGISPRSLFLLDLLKTLHRGHARFAGEQKHSLPDYALEELKTAYREQLEFFGENHPASPWFQDYQTLEGLPTLKMAMDLLATFPPPPNLRQQLANLAHDGNRTWLADALVQHLDKTHFNSLLVIQSAQALLALSGGDDLAAAEMAVRHFTGAFFQLAEKFQCDCHERFYLALLEHLAGDKNAPAAALQLTYLLALAGKNIILASEEASSYNTAADVLEFARKLMEKDKAFLPDPSFVSELIGYLRRIVNKKKLKTLTKRFQVLQVFFEKKMG